ncbi:putative bifunctional diguanylate cyclase/phosphodiesterase [Algicola sagamiensis]|uniref:putative bifunctional diguanylate cyclase/phosphodiesterase n=1 Tax=Algicola sagamiensis TaxID=163869 RepID=UPI0003664CC4|nr:EAL domain-containing protein [Algicola sagamiensis]
MAYKDGSLKNKIIALCIGLILLIAVTIMLSTWWSTSEYNEKQIDNEINKAVNVFEQYLSVRERLLITSTEILTTDFGFKQAVATHDANTITSVLKNHGSRINADLMLLTDLEGKVLSSSQPLDDANHNLSHLIHQSGSTTFILLDGSLYHMIMLPVRAPLAIAYAGVAFEIHQQLAQELKRLTGLNISFLANQTEGIVTTIPNVEINTLKQQLQTMTVPTLFGERLAYNNREISLNGMGNQSISILVSASLQPFYQAYNNLASSIFLLAGLTIFLGILLSGLLANTLTQQLSKLVQTTKRFAQGNYDTIDSPQSASSEVSQLILAFNEMGAEVKAREQQVKYQAQHDSLTGLFNRQTMVDRINQTLKAQTTFMLIASNIRNFRAVNDHLGPIVGDACLQALAERLELFSFEGQATHARLNGDEFLSLLILDDSKDSTQIVEALQDHLSAPVQVSELTLHFKFCTGVYIHEAGESDAKVILRRATIALDAARNEQLALRYYKSGEEENHLQKLAIIEQLRVALENDDGQLYMVFQPKLNLKTQKIDKTESLIRWQSPSLGFISPELFIALAEQSGLILSLTHWVIHQVLQELKVWQNQHLNVGVAINVSARDLAHKDFVDTLCEAVTHHQVSTNLITIELTERDIMDDESQGISVLKELKQHGFQVSLDDYGIGQSSLSKLRLLPIDELKLDMSFILRLDTTPDDQTIVKSTITLGHNLGLSVVAEGVENKASLQLLEAMSCDQIQGYYLSKPLTGEQFREWLQAYESKPMCADQ